MNYDFLNRAFKADVKLKENDKFQFIVDGVDRVSKQYKVEQVCTLITDIYIDFS